MQFTGERFIPNLTDKQLETEHKQRYYSICETVRGKNVLDAACGEGYGSYILSQFADAVVGIDISPETIEHARATYGHQSNLTFEIGSVDALQHVMDCSMDVVVSFETIEHINEQQQQAFLSEIKRVLKPEGILIISTPDKYWYSDVPSYRNEFHVKEFYKPEFLSFLKQKFKNVEIYYQKEEIVSIIGKEKEALFRATSYPEAKYLMDGKYLVAVCSDSEQVEVHISSIDFTLDSTYRGNVERILSLQDEVEERNAHLKKLDLTIDNLRLEIESKQTQLQEHVAEIQNAKSQANLLTAEIDSKDKEIQQLTEKLDNLRNRLNLVQSERDDLSIKCEEILDRNRELSTQVEIINQKNHELSSQIENEVQKKHELLNQIENEEQKNHELRIEIQNKVGHIELLLEQERKLMNILNSNGWKMLEKYYKFRDFIIPPNSYRRFFARLAITAIKRPQLVKRSFSKEKIRKLRLYLKTENADMAEHRLKDYLARNSEQPRQELKISEPQEGDFEILSFPYFEFPKVSIIIPVYNQWNYTYACLNSILKNTRGVSYEVIIADDMSSDNTIYADQWIKNIHVVRDGQNRGFLLNCNNAAQYGRGEYLFFLNNDTQVQEDWLTSLVQLLDQDPTIGMTGSKLIYPDGRQQEAGGIIWKDASGWNYGRLDDPEKPEYNYVKEVDYISGAAIMIRTSLWKQIGGFDERYVPAYYEDSDLAFEVRKHGFKVVFQPRSVVVHFEGISHGTDTGSGVKSYQVENQRKFELKWKEILNSRHFPNAEHVFYARDRSKEQKTLLVVDHYVPHYDKDAGGRSVYQYLKLYRSMGLHVIFIGDNYYRHEPYTTELQQLGIEVLYGNWYVNSIEDWIKRNGCYIDYVYLNRPHIAIKYIDWVKQYTKARIIYFGHDLHYVREQRNYEIEKNPELLKSAERWRKLEYELFEKADLIHVVGTYEQEIIRRQFPEKKVSNIPLFMVDEGGLAKECRTFEERDHFLFVGGFSHKPNIDAMLWFVNHVFPIITEVLPDAKLTIAGSNPPSAITDLANSNIKVTGYISDEALQELYNHSRVIVAPLRYGAGVKGKVIEALINKVPIVTTSIGAEGLVEAANIMAIADNAAEFAQNAIRLYTDENEWMKISNRSGPYLNQYFSKGAASRIIQEDFGLVAPVSITK